MSDYGIKIAKVGFDVSTAGDDDLVFSSKFNVLKVVSEGDTTISYTASSGSANKTVAHGLNFTPTFLAFLDNKNSKFFSVGMDSGAAFQNFDGNYVGLDGFTDSTNLDITVYVNSSSSLYGSNQTFNVHYYIFGDTARETSTTTSFPGSTENYGIKVSKAGKDVSSTYVEDMIITSRMPSMKIKLQGSTTITGTGTATVAHGLSFAPAFIVMSSLDNDQFNITYSRTAIGGPQSFAWSDTTNLNFRAYNFPGEVTYFKYIVFANSAT